MFIRLGQTRFRPPPPLPIRGSPWNCNIRNNPCIKLLNEVEANYRVSYVTGYDLDTFCIEFHLVLDNPEDQVIAKMHLQGWTFEPMSEEETIKPYRAISEARRREQAA